MNPDWTRWLVSSINNHLYSRRGTIQMHFDEQTLPAQQTSFEVRVIGPVFKQHNKSTYTVEISINILIKSLHSDDAFQLEKLIGQVLSMLTLTINVYQYPIQTLLGCLRRTNEPLSVKRFGQINPKIKISYASVETTYSMELNNGTN